MNGATNAVIGIVRDGMSTGWIGQSQGSGVQMSLLTTGVNEWRTAMPPDGVGKTLTAAHRQTGPGVGPPIDEQYLLQYSEYQTDKQNQNVFWNRFLPQDAAVLYTKLVY